MAGIANDRIRECLTQRLDHVQVGFIRRCRVRRYAVQQREVIMIPADRLVSNSYVGQRLHTGGYNQRHVGLSRLFQQQHVAGLTRTDFHKWYFETDEKIERDLENNRAY